MRKTRKKKKIIVYRTPLIKQIVERLWDSATNEQLFETANNILGLKLNKTKHRIIDKL